MNDIVEEIRQAYKTVGIRLDHPVAHGTYYRLVCEGCGRTVGNVGDKLLPGMAQAIVGDQLELYASGLLGCPCGHQKERTRMREPKRRQEAQQRYGEGQERTP